MNEVCLFVKPVMLMHASAHVGPWIHANSRSHFGGLKGSSDPTPMVSPSFGCACSSALCEKPVQHKRHKLLSTGQQRCIIRAPFGSGNASTDSPKRTTRLSGLISADFTLTIAFIMASATSCGHGPLSIKELHISISV